VTLKEDADGGTMNQKYCQVSTANGKVMLRFELAESFETGISQTMPVQPMSQTHAEGDNLRDAELQWP
jgi:shikimate 5-dehydrogenase